ncbi:MAG TPA: MFS transporter [Gemmatimonadetes bacterium]|nr:MFS transporter [Gemmatimonadota bacterium]
MSRFILHIMMKTISKLLSISPEELPLVLVSAAYFFSVLCGYNFLRPVREAMGVSGGMNDLRWLFAVTSIVSLVVVLCFGGLVARTNRRKFIPLSYGFVIVCLILFASLLLADILSGGGLIGSSAETIFSQTVGYVFFVWLSVINLFITSVFWAFLVDIFTVEQGKRMFAFIGIGGTLGALVGGWATSIISQSTESPYLPVGLLLVGAGFFCVAICLVLWLDRLADHATSSAKLLSPARQPPKRVGGPFWGGARAVFSSPYLLGIGAYVVLMAVSNTLIYFAQANIVFTNTDTFSERVTGFAQFDALAQALTLFTQIFITTRLIKRLGVGWTLSILPAVTILGFTTLSLWTTYGVMAIFQAVHRATRYAIARPARETLFSVVSTSDKYKAKPVVDVFLYRGGDLAGVGVEGAFAALGLSIAGISAATLPLVAAWSLLSLKLAQAQDQKNAS